MGSVDLSNFFTPIIEAGRLRMIMMMNEQRFLKIADYNDLGAGAFNGLYG